LAELGSPRLIWGRRNVGTETCPVSAITPESWRFIEEFAAWKLIGTGYGPDAEARSMDAMRVMEQEWEKEMQHVRGSMED